MLLKLLKGVTLKVRFGDIVLGENNYSFIMISFIIGVNLTIVQ